MSKNILDMLDGGGFDGIHIVAYFTYMNLICYFSSSILLKS